MLMMMVLMEMMVVVVGQFLTFLMVGISQDDDVGDDVKGWDDGDGDDGDGDDGGCCGFLPLDG